MRCYPLHWLSWVLFPEAVKDRSSFLTVKFLRGILCFWAWVVARGLRMAPWPPLAFRSWPSFSSTVAPWAATAALPARSPLAMPANLGNRSWVSGCCVNRLQIRDTLWLTWWHWQKGVSEKIFSCRILLYRYCGFTFFPFSKSVTKPLVPYTNTIFYVAKWIWKTFSILWLLCWCEVDDSWSFFTVWEPLLHV